MHEQGIASQEKLIGKVVPAGTYVRVDDRSYRAVTLERQGPLPATFDGHVALYCTSACRCMQQVNQEEAFAAPAQQ